MSKPTLNPTPDQTFEIIGSGAYNFVSILKESQDAEEQGDVERACEIRFDAFQRLNELLPEDDVVEIEWNHANSRAALEITYCSAIDHFLIGDYELSAALAETLLDMDSDDHFEVSELLAFDYLALGETELLEELQADLSDKSAVGVLMKLWLSFDREGVLDAKALGLFKRNFGAWYSEFTAEEHPADQQYMDQISSERPSAQARARQLWLQSEALWSGEQSAFIVALKNS